MHHKIYMRLENHYAICVELSNNLSDFTNEILNGIYFNLKPEYGQITTLIVKTSLIFKKYKPKNIEAFIPLLSSILSSAKISLVDNELIPSLQNIAFGTHLKFKSIADEQSYINYWFRVNSSRIEFDGENLDFTDQFYLDIANEGLQQFQTNHPNTTDELLSSRIVPIMTEISYQSQDNVKAAFLKYIEKVFETEKWRMDNVKNNS